jgi:hypothetical protein
MTTNNSFYATTTTKIALKHSCTILLIYIIVFSQDQDKTNSKKNPKFRLNLPWVERRGADRNPWLAKMNYRGHVRGFFFLHDLSVL